MTLIKKQHHDFLEKVHKSQGVLYRIFWCHFDAVYFYLCYYQGQSVSLTKRNQDLSLGSRSTGIGGYPKFNRNEKALAALGNNFCYFSHITPGVGNMASDSICFIKINTVYEEIFFIVLSFLEYYIYSNYIHIRLLK